MNDLLFYTLLIALLYYFLIYLPQQKKYLAPTKPLVQDQTTQTETPSEEDNSELEQTLDQLIKNIQQLNRQIK